MSLLSVRFQFPLTPAYRTMITVPRAGMHSAPARHASRRSETDPFTMSVQRAKFAVSVAALAARLGLPYRMRHRARG